MRYPLLGSIVRELLSGIDYHRLANFYLCSLSWYRLVSEFSCCSLGSLQPAVPGDSHGVGVMPNYSVGSKHNRQQGVH